jgi:sugar lactone lactonase YvrE
VLAEGIDYPEGPRWHDGMLWFADVHANRVMTLDGDGNLAVVVETEHPSGLGWLPDGRLVFSTVRAPYLKRLDSDGVTLVHDLGARGLSLNDMVAGPDGRIYLDLYVDWGTGAPRGEILLAAPDGEVRTVATDLMTPNGLAITPDGSTLIASETFAGRLLAFTILPDGGLADRHVFADLGGERRPDGLCLDAEGAVWVGTLTGGFLRVLDGGEITHHVETKAHWAVAPALGGADRRTLYLLTADTTLEKQSRGESKGYIEVATADVPGAGWP